MRREWRQIVILIVAICLVTAFFALGPLYARATIQSGLQYELAAASGENSRLTFVSPTPYKLETWTLISDQIGPLYKDLLRISRSALAIGGFQYLYGEVT